MTAAGRAAARTTCVLAACCLSAPVAAASTIEIAAYGWSTLPSGSIYTRYAGVATPPVDLRKDLAMRRHASVGGRLTWRPERRAVPNVTIEYVHMVADGVVGLRRSIVWEGVTYVVDGRLMSQADLKDGGVQLSWNAFSDKVVDVRAGIEAQWYSLHLPLAGTVLEQQPVPRTYAKAVSVGTVSWLPLLGLRFVFRLPHHVSVSLKGSYLPHSANYVYDLRGRISYRFDGGLMVFAGWRRFRLHLDNGNLTVDGDLEFTGLYTGIGFGL